MMQVLPESFAIEVECLSDWIVGTGAGVPGVVDKAAARDSSELPYIPPKTLWGRLRDAAETVATALDREFDGAPWAQWVDAIFGTEPDKMGEASRKPPRPSLLEIRPARLPADLVAALDGPKKAPLREALTTLQPGIRISDASGRVMDDYLRFEEKVRGGLTLTARARLGLGQSKAPQEATALLVMAAAFLRRVGAGRRRGAGLVRVSLPEAPSKVEVAAWLRGVETPRRPPAREAVAPRPGSVPALPAQPPAQWLSVPLRLELEQRVVAPKATVGNVVETLDFVPGTYLIPAVLKRLSALGVRFGPALGRGGVRVLTALPEVDGERGLPAPNALYRDKLSSGSPRGGQVRNALLEETGPGWVDYRRGWVGVDPSDGTLRDYRATRLAQSTHPAIDNQLQRTGGGLYTYEAIAEGEVLRTELRIRSDLAETLAAADSEWWKKLAGRVKLGRSKKDLGLAHLEVLAPATAVLPPALGEGRRVTLWCLSDVLLADERLRLVPTAEQLRRSLAERLGCAVELEAAHLRVRRTESWQARWNLPRPSLVGLAAGSCFVFEIQGGPEALEALAEIEASGLGLRTGEGFGEIRLAAPLLSKALSAWTPPAAAEEAASAAGSEEVVLQPGSPAFAVARELEISAWCGAIGRACLTVAATDEARNRLLGWSGGEGKAMPSNSQVAALAGQMELLEEPGDSEVSAFLKQILASEKRASSWPRDSLRSEDGETCGKVADLIAKREAVWQALGAESWPTLTADGREALGRSLWPEAVLQLIQAAARAHKRAGETSDSGEE